MSEGKEDSDNHRDGEMSKICRSRFKKFSVAKIVTILEKQNKVVLDCNKWKKTQCSHKNSSQKQLWISQVGRNARQEPGWFYKTVAKEKGKKTKESRRLISAVLLASKGKKLQELWTMAGTDRSCLQP